jgi:hypothetical protein
MTYVRLLGLGSPLAVVVALGSHACGDASSGENAASGAQLSAATTSANGTVLTFGPDRRSNRHGSDPSAWAR